MTSDSHHDEKTNIERLRVYLADGALSAKLVDTYAGSKPEGRAAALKTVAEDRLAQIRARIASAVSDAQD